MKLARMFGVFASVLLIGCTTGGPTGGQLETILVADSRGQYEYAARNVTNPSAAEFVTLDGRSAVGITLRYSDEGHPADWMRDGIPGGAQRFEIAERRSDWMQAGQVYWKKLYVYFPRGTDVLEIAHLTDFKRLFGETHTAVAALSLEPGYLRFQHSFGRPIECRPIRTAAGESRAPCNKEIEFIRLVPISSLQGRWVEFVFRSDWQNTGSGRFHFWIDGELKLGFSGPTAQGAQIIENKFGIYRLWFDKRGIPAPDLTVYFSEAGRSATCSGLGLPNCSELERDVNRLGYFGTRNRWVTDVRELDELIALGAQPVGP